MTTRPTVGCVLRASAYHLLVRLYAKTAQLAPTPPRRVMMQLVTSDCVGCEAGTYSTLAGARSADACRQYESGKHLMPTGSNAESDCMPCEPGKHSDTQGANSADVRASYGAGKYLKTQAMTRKVTA
jgi:hypothetical protein